jgi:hypothetical protein
MLCECHRDNVYWLTAIGSYTFLMIFDQLSHKVKIFCLFLLILCCLALDCIYGLAYLIFNLFLKLGDVKLIGQTSEVFQL